LRITTPSEMEKATPETSIKSAQVACPADALVPPKGTSSQEAARGVATTERYGGERGISHWIVGSDELAPSSIRAVDVELMPR